MNKNLLLGILLLSGLLMAFEITLPDLVTAASKAPPSVPLLRLNTAVEFLP